MQRLEYRRHIAGTIFIGVGGVAFLALSVTLIVLGSMSKSRSGRAGEIIIGYTGLPLPLYFIANALRPAALTADNTGLCLHWVFKNQRIPWSAVRGFRMAVFGRSGPFVQAILRTGGVISLPHTTDSGAKTERIVAELTAALNEHAQPVKPPG